MRFVKTLPPGVGPARRCRARSYSMPRHAMLNLASTAVLCSAPRAVACASRPFSADVGASRPFSADVGATCALHRIPCCPACHPQQYMTSRVTRSVESALRRLRLQKTQSVLQYLGVETWGEVRGGALRGGALRGGALRGGALRGGALRGGALTLRGRRRSSCISSGSARPGTSGTPMLK